MITAGLPIEADGSAGPAESPGNFQHAAPLPELGRNLSTRKRRMYQEQDENNDDSGLRDVVALQRRGEPIEATRAGENGTDEQDVTPHEYCEKKPTGTTQQFGHEFPTASDAAASDYFERLFQYRRFRTFAECAVVIMKTHFTHYVTCHGYAIATSANRAFFALAGELRGPKIIPRINHIFVMNQMSRFNQCDQYTYKPVGEPHENGSIL